MSKQDVKGLVDRLLELIEKLVGSTCFTREELDDVVRKLREAVDELQLKAPPFRAGMGRKLKKMCGFFS